MSREVQIKRGRPRKPFDQLSDIAKRKNAKKMRDDSSTEEIGFALEKCLKASGFLGASKVVKSIIANPHIGDDYLKSYQNQKIVKEYTADEAVALTMDVKFSKRQYDIAYFGAKERNCRLYPPYYKVLAARKRCYPSSEFVHIHELGFKIDLQAVLDVTASRLVETFEPQFGSQVLKLCLISKWGFDGASSQSQYKQKFEDPNADDSCIFITTLVPIVLRGTDAAENVYWHNSKPSSTTLCRPIRLEFQKETEQYTLQVNREINEEIAALRPTIIKNGNHSIEITHQLFCTMVDGKICNYLASNKSTVTCFICKAKPTEMNHLDRIYERPKDIEFYKFGLSTLHAWIRFMECVLHISYNMKFKKWSIREQSHKDEHERRKAEIQKDFKTKTGLKIDYVLQGKGSSNDGNTARRFFRDYEDTASITGFDVHLLKRFAVILQTMASGKEINIDAFSSYARDTAALYVQLYSWYYMPVTVHKILIHGSDVMQHAVVPIGQLSEEVQESRHKEVRRYREYNTRKTSRIKTNEDLLHALLISSDPVISSSRKTNNSKKMDMFPEALLLLSTDANFESDNE